VDIADGHIVDRLVDGIDPIHVAFAPNNRTGYVSNGRSYFFTEIDWRKREVVRRFPTHGGPNGIAVAPYHAPPQRRTLTFGACLPLSGQTYREGRDIRLGYQYWQELVNEAGGILVNGRPHLVNLVFNDSRSSNDEATIRSLTEDLIDRRGAE